MEKYVTSINKLVNLAIPNCSDLKFEADGGNPEVCFQYGMILLLGITKAGGFPPPPGNTIPLPKIDYASAKSYFGKPCLANNPDALRMLGFINELEGDFSSAFHYYSKSSDNDQFFGNYIDKVIDGRYRLQEYFNKLGVFPNLALNETITNVINDYIKGGEKKLESVIKIALICNDQPTCYEAADELIKAGDFYAASQWINKGNILSNDFLSISIANHYSEIKKLLERDYDYTETKAVEMILHDFNGKCIYILASLVCGCKGHYRELFKTIRLKGYLQLRIDGEFVENTQGMKVDRYKEHDIEVVVDKLQVSDNNEERLKTSISSAVELGKGQILILDMDSKDRPQSFAISGKVEIEEIIGNSLLENQMESFFAEIIKDKVIEAADVCRYQWTINVKQKIDTLVNEKRNRDYQEYLEESRIEEEKRKRTKKIIASIVIVAITLIVDYFLFIRLNLNLSGFLGFVVFCLPAIILYYIVKSVFREWDWDLFN